MPSQMDQCTLVAEAHQEHSWWTSFSFFSSEQNLIFGQYHPVTIKGGAVRRCTVEANTSPSKNTGANIPSATSQELMSRTEYFSDLKKSWRICLFKELQCTLQMLYVTYQLLVPKCWWNSSTIKTNLAYLSNNRNLI